jgi:hypothetical protein
VDADSAKAVVVGEWETARVLVKADTERAKTAAIARWGGGVSWEGSAESAKAIGIAVALSGLAGTMAARWRPIQSHKCKSQEGKRGTRDGKGEQRHVSKKMRLEVP